MFLHYVWVFFFLVAFVVALIKLIFFNDTEIFATMVNTVFERAELGFTISIGLTGLMAFWLGIMKIGEKGGAIGLLSRLLSPFLRGVFPDIPKGHPVYGSMVMNFSANMLGLDNAATPLGLRAMNDLQQLNPDKDTASNSQIMFLVLNTSGLTLVPIGVMVYRAQMGAANPADVFIPILLTTFVATFSGLIITAFYQKIKFFNRHFLLLMASMLCFLLAVVLGLQALSQAQLQLISKVAGNVIIMALIVGFIVLGMRKGINLFDTFVEGAKEGFTTAVKIIPFLVAILVGIGVFNASGVLDMLMDAMRYGAEVAGLPTGFVAGLPTAFMKPLSGTGARGMMLQAMEQYGVDSFEGKLAGTLQGATDTTFYILAVYFGSVNIKKFRHALPCGLFADLVGAIAGIFIAYLFFAG